MPTRMRGVRVPDELWLAAMARAAVRGETLSAVVRRALSCYVEEVDEHDPPCTRPAREVD